MKGWRVPAAGVGEFSSVRVQGCTVEGDKHRQLTKVFAQEMIELLDYFTGMSRQRDMFPDKAIYPRDQQSRRDSRGHYISNAEVHPLVRHRENGSVVTSDSIEGLDARNDVYTCSCQPFWQQAAVDLFRQLQVTL